MPKLPGVRHQDAVRVFEKLGFRIIRQSGHIVMSNGETRLTIPRANPVDPYTMGAIARDAGLTPDEFRKLLCFDPSAHTADQTRALFRIHSATSSSARAACKMVCKHIKGKRTSFFQLPVLAVLYLYSATALFRAVR